MLMGKSHERQCLVHELSIILSIENVFWLTVVHVQALEVPRKMGVQQGIMQGITVGFTNCTFLCSYALAFWYGSTRVRAGKYDGESSILKPFPHSAAKACMPV